MAAAKTKGKKATADGQEVTVTITEPNIQRAAFTLIGTAPYVCSRFANKAEIMLKQQEGSTGKKGKAKKAKDFEANYEAAKHICETDAEGRKVKPWCGIPASAIRSAVIAACTLVNIHKTLAKKCVFVVSQGLDQDGYPCVKINGTPEMHTGHVRNATGVIDIRARPMWRTWTADIEVEYDADLFTLTDVTNLLMRAGRQIGLGEGRPDSKSSTGMGWGLFKLKQAS